MKQEKDIRQLIDLLMAGDITPAEQRQLQTLLSADDLAPEFAVYRDMMAWMDRPLPMPSDEDISELSESSDFSDSSECSDNSEISENSNRKVMAGAAKPVRKPWTLSRVAACIAIVFCLGTVAATITYRAVVETEASSEDSTFSTIPASPNTSKNLEAINTKTILPDSITFNNLPLTEIAKQITGIFGSKVVFADRETAELRLYFILPKGSSVEDFVKIIDEYETLAATIKENVITIQRQEAKQ